MAASMPTGLPPSGAQYFWMSKVGDWQGAKNLMATMAARAKTAAGRAVRDEAMWFLRSAVASFREQGLTGSPWQPITPLTQEIRKNSKLFSDRLGTSSGGQKALVRTGYLRRSVNITGLGNNTWFVGVHRTSARGSYNVADIHENGPKIIPITEKMRKFFMLLLAKKVISKPWPPASKKYIVLPRRSFLADAYKKHKVGMDDRVMKRFWYYVTEGRILKHTTGPDAKAPPETGGGTK